MVPPAHRPTFASPIYIVQNPNPTLPLIWPPPSTVAALIPGLDPRRRDIPGRRGPSGGVGREDGCGGAARAAGPEPRAVEGGRSSQDDEGPARTSACGTTTAAGLLCEGGLRGVVGREGGQRGHGTLAEVGDAAAGGGVEQRSHRGDPSGVPLRRRRRELTAHVPARHGTGVGEEDHHPAAVRQRLRDSGAAPGRLLLLPAAAASRLQRGVPRCDPRRPRRAGAPRLRPGARGPRPRPAGVLLRLQPGRVSGGLHCTRPPKASHALRCGTRACRRRCTRCGSQRRPRCGAPRGTAR